MSEHFRVAGENRFVAADLLAQAGVFLEDLVALERRQLAEPQIDDRLGLGFGHAVDVERAEFAPAERRTARRRAPAA